MYKVLLLVIVLLEGVAAVQGFRYQPLSFLLLLLFPCTVLHELLALDAIPAHSTAPLEADVLARVELYDGVVDLYGVEQGAVGLAAVAGLLLCLFSHVSSYNITVLFESL